MVISALQCKVQCKFTYFIKNGGMLIVFIKRDLFVAPIKIPSRVNIGTLNVHELF